MIFDAVGKVSEGYVSGTSTEPLPAIGAPFLLTTSYQDSALFRNVQASGQYTTENLKAKKSADGKTISWYHPVNAAGQFNKSGTIYNYIILG